MSLKLPCNKCEHLCSYDAAFCPNCGSNNPFDLPSRIEMCLAGLVCLLLSYLAGKSESFPILSWLVFLVSLLCFVIAIFKTEILLFAARVKYYRDGGE
jgi:hypothetical protein